MIKTLIGIAIIALLGFGGWKLYQVWDKYSSEKDLQEQQAAAAASVVPEQLAGMPSGWEENFQKANNAAKNGDVKALHDWLKAHGQQVDDPRRAWIELDYMVMISRTDPQEARAIFDSVKDRTPQDSPVYPRIKQLEKTYQ
jgi:hypothetical protein